jgi:hypothetical protein
MILRWIEDEIPLELNLSRKPEDYDLVNVPSAWFTHVQCVLFGNVLCDVDFWPKTGNTHAGGIGLDGSSAFKTQTEKHMVNMFLLEWNAWKEYLEVNDEMAEAKRSDGNSHSADLRRSVLWNVFHLKSPSPGKDCGYYLIGFVKIYLFQIKVPRTRTD